jgi:hypothetical protein
MQDHLDEAQELAELTKLRKQAWDEYQKRINEMGYTQEQQACFLSGMAVMWRLIRLDHKPLFTYGPDGLPRELAK